MDPVTHTLTGAALSRAGLHRATPLATAALVIGANAPDIDVLAYLQGGSYAALGARRGITHGPLALLLLPVITAAGIMVYDRIWRRRRRPHATPAAAVPLLVLAFIGTLTHPLLDWMNTYGIRLLMPFSERWFYGDALFIIDPWVWLALAVPLAPFASSRRGRLLWVVLGVLATIMVVTAPQVTRVAQVVWMLLAGPLAIYTLLSWRRSSAPPRLDPADRSVTRFQYRAYRDMERARARGEASAVAFTAFAEARPVERIAAASLVAVALYIAGMVVSDVAARRIVAQAATTAGLDTQDFMVAPVPANPFAAEVVVETAEAYHYGSFGWLRQPRVRWHGVSIAKGERTAEVLATLQLQDVRDFLRWSRYPYVEVGEDAEGRFVRFGDGRYPSRMRGGLSGVVVRIEGTPRVQP